MTTTWTPKLLTADAVLLTAWAEPTWIVPQLIPAGLTLLAGKPKCGKSWLALQIAQAVSTGTSVLGVGVEPRRVLYLALEDNARRLKARMEQQGWVPGSRVDFMLSSEFRQSVGSLALQGKNATRGGHLLAEYVKDKGYGLVIVDTLSRAGLGDQLDHSGMSDAIGPLQSFSLDIGFGLLFLDHHNKSLGDTPDAVANILGSTAKGGCADTLLGLYRRPGESDAKLIATGRDIENQALALRFEATGGQWTRVGTVASIELTQRRQEILDALGLLGRASLPDLAKHLGQDRGNTGKRLRDLIDANLVRIAKSPHGLLYELGAEDPFDLAMR